MFNRLLKAIKLDSKSRLPIAEYHWSNRYLLGLE